MNQVYATKPQTLEEMRDEIEHAINDIPLAINLTVCRNIRGLCFECSVTENGNKKYKKLTEA